MINKFIEQENVADAAARIMEIDKWFEEATGWGSWMVGMANEREHLVNMLRARGHHIEHKYQARTANGGRTD